MKIDLDPAYLKVIKDILSKSVPGNAVWVFGSRINGKAKKFSDIDLAIITSKPLSLNIMTKLQDSFSESNLPIKVDIVDWSVISEDFKKIINEKHQVLLK